MFVVGGFVGLCCDGLFVWLLVNSVATGELQFVSIIRCFIICFTVARCIVTVGDLLFCCLVLLLTAVDGDLAFMFWFWIVYYFTWWRLFQGWCWLLWFWRLSCFMVGVVCFFCWFVCCVC